VSHGVEQGEGSADERRRARPILGWLHDLVALLVVSGFVAFLWSRRDHLASVLDVSLARVGVLCGLVVLTWLVVGGEHVLLYRACGIHVGFWECVLLMAGSGFGNYLPMRLGTVLRARYLKSLHGFSFARFGSAFGVRTILMLVASGILGLVAAIGVAWGSGRLSVELLLAFLAMIVLPAIGWVTPLPGGTGGGGRIGRIFRDFVEGVRTLRHRPGTSLAVLALIVVEQASLVVRFSVASTATGGEASPASLLVLAALATLTSYLSVTPGGLGVREAVMGYATYATGAPFASGVYVGTVDRAIQLGMVAVFGGASFAVMWWKTR
jgi:uncharacterized membrane protein YbhN (UPF0104 family)